MRKSSTLSCFSNAYVTLPEFQQINNALTQELSHLSEVIESMKVKTTLRGVWVPWPCLNYSKIIRGGQTETENTLWTLSCFLCVFQTVKGKFSILRGPLLQIFQDCYVKHFKEPNREFKNTLRTNFRFCLQPYSQNKDFLNVSFLKEFSWKQDDLSVKNKKLLPVTKNPHSGQTTSLLLKLKYLHTWQKDLAVKSKKHSASNLLLIL